jgi:hypothetical protein
LMASASRAAWYMAKRSTWRGVSILGGGKMSTTLFQLPVSQRDRGQRDRGQDRMCQYQTGMVKVGMEWQEGEAHRCAISEPHWGAREPVHHPSPPESHSHPHITHPLRPGPWGQKGVCHIHFGPSRCFFVKQTVGFPLSVPDLSRLFVAQGSALMLLMQAANPRPGLEAKDGAATSVRTSASPPSL